MNMQARAPRPHASATGSPVEVRPLLLLNNLDVGGAQTAVLNLAIGLASFGCTARVLSWRHSGPLEDRFLKAGVAPEVPDDGKTGGWARARVPGLLRRRMRADGLNVLHAHMSDSALWAAVGRRTSATPSIITHHTTDLIDTVGIGRPLYGWSRRRLLSACARAVSHNIAVSNAVAERLVEETGVSRERVTVIENGLPLPPEPRVAAAIAARGTRLAKAAGLHIVAVGRLTREKGFDALIRAMPAILARYPSVTATIVGDGPYRGVLCELVSTLQLEDRVHLPGFTADVGSVLEAADIFAAPSHIEGLPMAVIEAMAWGVPVVVSDIPGHRELVEDRVTGSRIPVDAPERLADAVIETIAEHERATALAERAFRAVRRTFSAEVMAERHIALYRRLLSDAR